MVLKNQSGVGRVEKHLKIFLPDKILVDHNFVDFFLRHLIFEVVAFIDKTKEVSLIICSFSHVVAVIDFTSST